MVLYFRQAMWQNCNKIGFEPVLKVSDVPQIMTMNAIQGKYKRGGFSLIELLAVMAVIAIMTSLLVPAISGISSSSGRRGAVNTLMNTFEQARVAALQTGQNVYVGFADSSFPVADMQYAAFMVFRDATDEEKAANSGPYVILKKWTKLPKNISFKRINNSIVPMSGGQTQFAGLNALLPGQYQILSEKLPVMTFNSSGVIEGGSSPLQLFLYEGYYTKSTDTDNFTRNAQTQSTAGLFEKIAFSRYTGRAQLDITSLQ